jgi:hypothetical protein
MLTDIRLRLAAAPFVPFSIRMADGREYAVPTVDHIFLPLGNTRVVVTDDDGATTVLSALLISGIVDLGRPEGVSNV